MNSINNLTEENIQARINEIDSELADLKDLKRKNPLSSHDVEDVSDKYQYHLEWNYLTQDLQDERRYLIEQRNKFHEVEQDTTEED